MKLKLILSLLFGALFIWLAVYDVDFSVLVSSLATMNWLPFIPFTALVIIYHCLRVWRWQLILGKNYPVPFRRLFSINMIGFFAINALPFRLGEIARPYLLMERENVPLGTALASALIERMLDFLCMLLVLALVVFTIDLPTTSITLRGETYPIMGVVRNVFLLAAVPAVGGLIGLMLFEEWMYKLLHFTIGRMHAGIAARMETFFRSFMESLRPLKSPKVLLVQAALTVVIWSITPMTEWLMFRMFHLDHLGFDAALTVVAAILVGMLIPGPPGFAGNFEAATKAGMLIYHVDETVALAYGLMLHWTQFAMIAIMGMFFLYKEGISFRSVVKFSRELKAGTRGA